MNSFRHRVVESDLLVFLVLILYPAPKIRITFGHVSRSCGCCLESSFNSEPFAPAVSRAAGNVEVLLYPRGESSVLLHNTEVVACTLSAELFAEVVQQWSQVLLSKLLMLLPDRLDCSFEFVLVQFADFRIGIGRIGRVASMRVWSRRLRWFLVCFVFLLVGQKHTCGGCHAHPPRHIRSFFHRRGVVL